MLDEVPEWTLRGKCRGICYGSPETEDPFFPDVGGYEAYSKARIAKAICNGDDGEPKCPVKKECLEFALREGIKIGIWGGTSHRERLEIRKERKEARERRNARRRARRKAG